MGSLGPFAFDFCQGRHARDGLALEAVRPAAMGVVWAQAELSAAKK